MSILDRKKDEVAVIARLNQLDDYLAQHEEGLTVTFWTIGQQGEEPVGYRVDCRDDFGKETRSEYGEGDTSLEALAECLKNLLDAPS